MSILNRSALIDLGPNKGGLGLDTFIGMNGQLLQWHTIDVIETQIKKS